mgnify:CR=1 FL=1
MNEILKVEHLKKIFKLNKKQQKIENGEKYKIAVNDLSFSIYKGEIYGLLGPNGAGKTTTLRMLSTLIKPDEGDAFLNGISVKKEPEKIRKMIGFLTSDLKLDNSFTPNYLYDYFSSLYGVDNLVREERKEKLFKKFGIDKFKEVKIGDLSTGMKQKVSIVISLVHNPDFIIFDEPTNGLDVITAKVVTDYLIELKNEGKTILLSTHIFSLVEKICDRVGIIINGKMIVSEKIETLIKDKSLEETFFDIYVKELGDKNE